MSVVYPINEPEVYYVMLKQSEHDSFETKRSRVTPLVNKGNIRITYS